MDEQFMQRALELARQGEGLTRPNPPVGAVLVKEGRKLAEGWHRKAGAPHAERDCLNRLPADAGSLRNTTLYITLEPCSTGGRTPPCTNLILEHGIGRVAVAAADPNPAHAGHGLKILSEADVEVVSGVCEAEGKALIAPFEKFITAGMPYVTLKLATTLDGRIADAGGASKWLTGEAAREEVQAMRRRADAVMVGAATVRADNPSLLPRPAEGRAPWRVIAGEHIPQSSRVLTDEAADRTLVRSGDWAGLLRRLAAEQQVMHLLCEGGGTLAAALLDAGLLDELAFFVAPKLLGADGRPSFNFSAATVNNLRKLVFTSINQVGEDLLIRARLEQKHVYRHDPASG